MQLRGHDGVVELKLADGSIETAEDAESLLYQETGLEFPVNGLRYWVMGIPRPLSGLESEGQAQPPTNVVLVAGSSNIESMEQSGWLIEYSRYRMVAMDAGQQRPEGLNEKAGIEMPRKIIMKNDEVKIRLFIDRWQAEI